MHAPGQGPLLREQSVNAARRDIATRGPCYSVPNGTVRNANFVERARFLSTDWMSSCGL